MAEGIGVHATNMAEAIEKARELAIKHQMPVDGVEIRFTSNEPCVRRCSICAAPPALDAEGLPAPVLPPWPEPVCSTEHEKAIFAPWLTDKDIVDALHSLGIDTEMSKYGFAAIQVRGTNVPGIRRLVDKLARQDQQPARASIDNFEFASLIGKLIEATEEMDDGTAYNDARSALIAHINAWGGVEQPKEGA